MSISFEYYKVFYYVAKYNKISAAAEKLYISQPAITQTIKKLEEQIGEKLIFRTNTGIKLTEQGNALYGFISESIRTLENTETRFGKYKNLQEGSIKIRTGSNVAKFLLYDAIEKFSKKYPCIKIEVATESPKKSVQMLYEGEIDMMMLYLPYNIEYSNLKIIECVKKDYIFAMSKEFCKNNNVNIKKIEDLNNYPLIIPKKYSATRNIFDNKFKKIIHEYRYEVAAEQMKKEFIMRGMGIGYLIRDEIEDEIKSGEAIEIKLPNIDTKGAIGIIVHDDYLMNFATKELVKYIQNEL